MDVITASGPAAGSCAVTYRVTGEWPGGFQGEVVVRNTGSTAVDGWTLRWTFPTGQRITSLWGGTVTQSGAEVSVEAAPYTATIPPSGSVSLGFTGTRAGTATDPTVFLLNGAECSAA
ncbi:cellulose-binding domain-containing protein [Streptomyces cellulosae]